jgi:hypothetical protein
VLETYQTIRILQVQLELFQDKSYLVKYQSQTILMAIYDKPIFLVDKPTTKASKPHHFIRITTGMRNDLLMWKMFLEKFNGVSYILEVEWMSNVELEKCQ